ncbi:Ras-specific guanine nucleotide-releasing factor RalGPS2 [Varanus komodoensis]|nr:Ras-specific guanine nucleotide-releasing factor RalGPS2 [Varanus komodoensis]
MTVEHLESKKPENSKHCEEFLLGIYLSDLTYIDSAYPSTGSILENEQRSNLMNNILRIISDLQQSCEYDIPALLHVQKYLNSVQYIEELQKFVEDDNYKLSLKIEPGTSTPRSAASREDLVGPEAGVSPQSVRKNAAAEGALLPPTPPSPRNLMPHGHRKCHSLGYNFIHKMNTAEFKSATFPNAGPRHLLDDSVMEPLAPSRGQAESSTLSSGISIGKLLGTTFQWWLEQKRQGQNYWHVLVQSFCCLGDISQPEKWGVERLHKARKPANRWSLGRKGKGHGCLENPKGFYWNSTWAGFDPPPPRGAAGLFQMY